MSEEIELEDGRTAETLDRDYAGTVRIALPIIKGSEPRNIAYVCKDCGCVHSRWRQAVACCHHGRFTLGKIKNW